MTDLLHKTVVLACPPARAFMLFTEQISEWWPPERRHTGDPHSQLQMVESGRFWERSAEGREVELGRVRRWDPPERLVLDWYPGTDAEHPTEVEIHFVAEGEATRVTVLHRPTPVSAALWSSRAPRYDASWALVLAALEHASAGLP